MKLPGVKLWASASLVNTPHPGHVTLLDVSAPTPVFLYSRWFMVLRLDWMVSFVLLMVSWIKSFLVAVVVGGMVDDRVE
ncbi:hypothetical protein HanIR_Chr04g0150361 [Helianthus annuus]|nr:hypothetical protein HanIR_Chr04g0150361 [Helianthus annuus]